MELILLEEVEEIVKLALYSGYLKGMRPVSLLIVAKVGTGKTELLKKFATMRGLTYLTDVTAYGITKKLLPELEAGLLKHIIIPDLITPLSKQTATRRTFISFMKDLIEEGIVEIQTYAVSIKKKGLRCGLITTIAKEKLYSRRRDWQDIGFMSRMLPVSYDYTQQSVIKILNKIAMRDSDFIDKIELDLPKKEVVIEEDRDLNKKLIPYSIIFQQAEKIYGFRRQRQLQTLMMASALDDGRRKVEQKDFERIVNLTKFINLKFTKI